MLIQMENWVCFKTNWFTLQISVNVTFVHIFYAFQHSKWAVLDNPNAINSIATEDIQQFLYIISIYLP